MAERQLEQDPPAELPVRHIFRWDLDKTYIQTDFDSLRGLIRAAVQRAEEKQNVPGADALLREVTREREDGRVIVTFISGSPTQMRRTLEQKFAIDGIRPDAFILKPQLGLLFRGKFRAIKGQVGYKLDALLRVRTLAPPAPETLFGDDAEQDAFIYSLYADLAAGLVDADLLERLLREAQVYEDTRESIMERASKIEHAANVQRIFIHLDRRSAPGRFMVFGPRVVPIINYFQAALMLYADEVLDLAALMRVAAGMVHRSSYGLMELSNSYQDLARRGHMSAEDVERLVADVDAFEDEVQGLPPGFAGRLVSRMQALAPRTAAPRREWSGPPDYLEVLRADHALRKSLKAEPPRRGLFT